jgi:heparin binding hemagglutinin HbhA
MNLVDSARKTVTTTVTNPKPFYFAAGVGDAAVSALKDAPSLLTDAGGKAGEVATSVAGKVAGVAETVQSKIALGQLQDDAKALRDRIAEPDLRAAREKAQTLLLMQVGRALEVAGKAVETYDGYSERGKAVVERVLAGRVTEVEVVAVQETRGAEPVRVESVVVIEDEESKAEAAAKPAETAKPTEATTPAKPAAAPKAAAEQPKSKSTGTSAKKATPRRGANGTAAKKADQA